MMTKPFQTEISFPSLVKFLLLMTLFVSTPLFLVGCDLVPYLHMRDQPKYEPYEASAFFEDGLASRPAVANTVARGTRRFEDPHFYEGTVDGEYVDTFPYAITLEKLKRGQERYNIYCSPCHGQVGNGLGMIVQRGLKQPDSFHSDRLRGEPVGYYYDVISNGFGAMFSYSSRVPPDDRWAIIAYIRALQYSQNANAENFPEIDFSRLDEIQAPELDTSEEGDDHE